jgi:DNA-binding CsgD family transcriptional regulator
VQSSKLPPPRRRRTSVVAPITQEKRPAPRAASVPEKAAATAHEGVPNPQEPRVVAEQRKEFTTKPVTVTIPSFTVTVLFRQEIHRPQPIELNKIDRERERDLLRLLPRQREVYQKLELGKANKEISRELNIEVCTVSFHVTRILRRLGLKNRTEILAKRLASLAV